MRPPGQQGQQPSPIGYAQQALGRDAGRGTGHDEAARYTEDPEIYERVINRLRRKYETAKSLVPKPVIEEDGSEIGLIAYGSTDPAIQEARDRLEMKGIKTDYMRLRALPFTPEVSDFIRRHDRNYVVELNRDGQLHQLLRLEVQGCTNKLVSLAHIDGLPLTADWVVRALLAEEEIIT